MPEGRQRERKLDHENVIGNPARGFLYLPHGQGIARRLVGSSRETAGSGPPDSERGSSVTVRRALDRGKAVLWFPACAQGDESERAMKAHDIGSLMRRRKESEANMADYDIDIARGWFILDAMTAQSARVIAPCDMSLQGYDEDGNLVTMSTVRVVTTGNVATAIKNRKRAIKWLAQYELPRK